MDSLVKLLGRFLQRDLLYIIGGSSIIISFLYSFDKLSLLDQSSSLKWGIILTGYIIGYLTQESMSIIGIITTAKPKSFRGIRKWAYHRFTNDDFSQDILNSKDIKFVYQLKSMKEAKVDKEFYRIINLKHIGTTMGSNWLISSLILIIHTIRNFNKFNLTVSFFVLVCALLLILLAWIKSYQQIKYVYEFSNHNHDSNR